MNSFARGLAQGLLIICLGLLVATAPGAQEPAKYAMTEGDYVTHDFKFKSGEQLAELRLHYATLGKLTRDAQGQATNAVLILHGTGGAGGNFIRPEFAGELFGPGQLLDSSRYFIILP